MKLIDLLKEVDPTFGNAAFADPSQSSVGDSEDYTYKKFLRLQDKSPKEKEPNTKKEEEIYNALKSWLQSSTDSSSKILAKNLNAIKKGKDLFPSIFVPDKENGTSVYRGIEEVSPNMLKTLAQTTERDDWDRIKSITGQVIADNLYNWYTCKKPIKYNPRREWQSWTYNKKGAAYFAASAMLTTKQDDNFYFSTKTTKIIFGYNNEKEVLHYGQEFSNPVYISIDEETFNRIPFKKSTVGASSEKRDKNGGFNYNKLTHDDQVDLGGLVHDKGHVMQFGKRSNGLENALKYYTETSPGPLYRGISGYEKKDIENLKVGQKIPPSKTYRSFSEDKNLARDFAESSKVLLILDKGTGFCYWKYSIWELQDIKKRDPEEYESVDGDHLMDLANEEKEWILPIDSVYLIKKISKVGDYTEIEVKQI